MLTIVPVSENAVKNSCRLYNYSFYSFIPVEERAKSTPISTKKQIYRALQS